MHKFNVAFVHCSYLFWVSNSNHHQTVHQKCQKKVILHMVRRRVFGLTTVSYFL